MRLTRKRRGSCLALLHPPPGQLDPLDGRRPQAVALRGDRGVRRRHLQRRDAVLEAAERLRGIALERRRDAHVARRLLDLVRAQVHRELDVDRVVGGERRLAQRHVARALAAVRSDLEVPVLRVAHDRGRLRHVVRAVGVDALAQRGHQRHHLERRSGPAVALGGEVELRDAVVAGGGHRLDVAVLGIDRDDRRRRADRPEVPLDRRAGLLLLVEVDRRIDLHAAHADGARAVLAEQLVLDVVEEVLLAPAREVGRELDAELPLRRPVRGGRRDHARAPPSCAGPRCGASWPPLGRASGSSPRAPAAGRRAAPPRAG